MAITTTHTRVHTTISFANPHLKCDGCGQPVTGWHSHAACGCDTTSWNVPCGCRHAGATSSCPSWSPEDGCICSQVLGTPAHEAPKES